MFSQVANDNVEVGFSFGAANYQGDVVVPVLFTTKETNLALGLHIRKLTQNDQWAFRGNLYYANLTGDDLNFEERQNNPNPNRFESTLFEFTAVAEFYPLASQIEGGKSDAYGNDFYQRFQPFLYLGLGGVYADPETTGLPASAPELNGDYSNVHFSVPIGAGFRWDLNNKWAINFEGGFRWPITDYLDGLSESRDPDDNDWYIIGGVSFFYKLGDRRAKLVSPTVHIESVPSNTTVASKSDVLTADLNNIEFESGSAELGNSALSILDDIFSIMQEYPNANLNIEGHTDNTGETSSDKELSSARAKNCYEYLVQKGVVKGRMYYSAMGDREPISNNDNTQGRQKNRRVEFELYIR
jgi:outer membrane protein OmpA-like peptidoglycan-associated protein